MKKLTVLAAMALAVLSVHSEVAQTNDVAIKGTDGDFVKIGNKTISREQLKDSLGRVKYKRTGGYVRKEGSAKGCFVLLNAQGALPASELQMAVAVIDRQVLINTKIVDSGPVGIATLKNAIAEAGGEVGVAVVDDESLPALLGAPEEGWGIVNVAKLRHEDNPVFAARVRREILRAFGLAAGAMYAAQGDFVLQPVRKPSDLDKLKREEFGIIMRRIYPLSLPYYGITPWQQATYLKACEEGWAPAPTNDVQKAIWDQTHAIPKNPMKIEFDPKKGR